MNKILFIALFLVFVKCNAMEEKKLSEIANLASSIQIVAVTQGRTLNDCGEYFCGFEYKFMIEQTLKGPESKHVVVRSGRHLSIGDKYLALLNNEEVIAIFSLKSASAGKSHMKDELLGIYDDFSIRFPQDIPLTVRKWEVCNEDDCVVNKSDTVFHLTDFVTWEREIK